ncbi:hypothetical protein KHM83_11085 [Fusibacter paucivorans]|uniref:Uncharacterized protein n=1 Tax=Fusibacter paucivorans TaxID=76009 RepID=A0ABS5PQ01_9FIRM|nr:hypothetical protein [Fusibacter paucivorans]MBS7527225.1 hypothetical protein [Fusibacter paucivorans]
MKNKKYGEVKTRKNLFPQDARNIVSKGSIRILISQCEVSNTTKSILDEGNVTLYEGVEAEEVNELREKVREKLLEKGEQERE